jgi:hypothetical protein
MAGQLLAILSDICYGRRSSSWAPHIDDDPQVDTTDQFTDYIINTPLNL